MTASIRAAMKNGSALLRILPAILLTLTAACGSVDPMADDATVGDDTIGDDGDDGMAPDAAPPPPEPDAPPPPECTSDAACPADEPICQDGDCVCPTECCVSATCPALSDGLVPQICQGGDCCVANGTVIGIPALGCGSSVSLPASACCSGRKNSSFSTGFTCVCVP